MWGPTTWSRRSAARRAADRPVGIATSPGTPVGGPARRGRAHGKAAIDAVHLDIDDLDGLAAEASDAAASGFARHGLHPPRRRCPSCARPTGRPTPTCRGRAACSPPRQGQRGVFRWRGPDGRRAGAQARGGGAAPGGVAVERVIPRPGICGRIGARAARILPLVGAPGVSAPVAVGTTGSAARTKELRLLGGFEALEDGLPVVIAQASARMVAYLAVHGRTSRAVLAARLWPDQPRAQGLANVRTVLWRMRRCARWLGTPATSVELAPDVVVDTHRLTTATTRHRAARRARCAARPVDGRPAPRVAGRVGGHRA